MNEKRLHDILAYNLTQLMNNEQNHIPSMRYLSTCMGKTDSYTQKIVSGKSFPSMKMLLEIANHYEVEPWTLLFDSNEKGEEFMKILKELSACSKESLPSIYADILYYKRHEKEQLEFIFSKKGNRLTEPIPFFVLFESNPAVYFPCFW